jgi:hypothetical protein
VDVLPLRQVLAQPTLQLEVALERLLMHQHLLAVRIQRLVVHH